MWAQLKDKIQSAFFFEQLIYNHFRINVTSRLLVKKANPPDGFAQARNQLGIPGRVKSFLRGAQTFKLCPIRSVTSLGHQGWRRVFWEEPTFFKLCPIVFNYAQQIFPGGRNGLLRGFAPLSPLVTGLCPIVLKYIQHIFTGGAKIVLPGFAPQCCVDRLTTVEALKMNVHLLLLWLATLQISATVCECLIKRHNWSVSTRFNSQLRVWVTVSGPMRGGPAGTLFRGSTATEGRETQRQARNQFEIPRWRWVFWDGHNFFNYVQ